MASPSLHWEKLGDKFWRSKEVCQLNWFGGNNSSGDDTLEMSCSATCLSLFAIEVDNSVHIFDRTGHFITKTAIDQKFGKLVKLAFTEDEDLVLVYTNGVEILKDWNVSDKISVPLVVDVDDTIWDYKSGVLILRNSKDIYQLIDNKLVLLHKNTENYEILVKDGWDCKNGDVVILDLDSVWRFDLRSHHFKKIIAGCHYHRLYLSYNGQLCLYNGKGDRLDFYSLKGDDLNRNITLQKAPRDIKWDFEGNLSVLYEDELFLYNSQSQYVSFWYPYGIVLLEIFLDGILVVTTNQLSFVTQVKESTSSIFKIGSVTAGALLLDAFKELETNLPKAIENLRSIDLSTAVVDCLTASLEESDVKVQKQLLGAASFGKESLPYKSFDSSFFVSICNKLKILNFLNSIDFFITNDEYDYYKIEGILDMLLKMGKYYESIKLLELANRPDLKPKVFVQWCIVKIRVSSDLEDIKILDIINKQLSVLNTKNNVPMATIAGYSYSEGRFKLARELCKMEKFTPTKVAMLMKLEDYNIAVQECLHEGSCALTISLLLELKDKLPASQFTKLLILEMRDTQLFPYYEQDNYEFLYDYFRQIDEYKDLAHVLRRSVNKNLSLQSIQPQILELYNTIPHKTEHLKQDISLIQREVKRNQYMTEINNKLGTNFETEPLNDVLAKLIELKQDRVAKDLVKKFDIPERNFHITTLKVLVKQKRFEELSSFMTGIRPAISYQYIFDYIKKRGHKLEASEYISHLHVSYSDKMALYLECKNYRAAVELAGREKDVMGLKDVYAKIPANEPQVKALANQILATL